MDNAKRRELRRLVRKYTELAADTRRLIYLNPRNAATWRADAARFAALAAAAEVDLQISIYKEVRS